jgi:hypothetical protein
VELKSRVLSRYENTTSGATSRKKHKVVFILTAKSISDEGSRNDFHFSLLETNQIRLVQDNHLLDILTTSSTIKTTHIPRQETINLDGIIHWKPELTTMNIQIQAYTTCSGIRSHKIL